MQTQMLINGSEDSKPVEIARFIERKAEEISSVIGILQEMAAPRSTTYLGDIKMIDIRAELENKLQQIKEKYQT